MRFRVLAYVCMGVLVVTGVVMVIFNPSYSGYDLGSTWGLFLMLKHIFVLILIIVGIYILQSLFPAIEKAGAKGPSPEVAKLQKRQMAIGMTTFVIGLLVLLFTAVTSVV
jgi:putative copper export protein